MSARLEPGLPCAGRQSGRAAIGDVMMFPLEAHVLAFPQAIRPGYFSHSSRLAWVPQLGKRGPPVLGGHRCKVWVPRFGCPKRFGSRETFMIRTARAAITLTLLLAGSALAQQTPPANQPATPSATQPATPPPAPPPVDFSKV